MNKWIQNVLTSKYGCANSRERSLTSIPEDVSKLAILANSILLRFLQYCDLVCDHKFVNWKDLSFATSADTPQLSSESCIPDVQCQSIHISKQ